MQHRDGTVNTWRAEDSHPSSVPIPGCPWPSASVLVQTPRAHTQYGNELGQVPGVSEPRGKGQSVDKCLLSLGGPKLISNGHLCLVAFVNAPLKQVRAAQMYGLALGLALLEKDLAVGLQLHAHKFGGMEGPRWGRAAQPGVRRGRAATCCYDIISCPSPFLGLGQPPPSGTFPSFHSSWVQHQPLLPPGMNKLVATSHFAPEATSCSPHFPSG